MRKTCQPTINLLKPLQNELNKVLRNPVYAFTHAENMRRERRSAINYLQTGMVIVPPSKTYTDAPLVKPEWIHTFDDDDPIDPGAWYFIDEKNIKIMEENMDDQENSRTYKVAYGRRVPDVPKEEPKKKLCITVDIEIKDGHILAEFGCVKHVCHNLTELMVLAKKELLKEMPILKDFGKPSSHRPIKKKTTDSNKS